LIHHRESFWDGNREVQIEGEIIENFDHLILSLTAEGEIFQRFSSTMNSINCMGIISILEILKIFPYKIPE
jgi:hypothetical protein